MLAEVIIASAALVVSSGVWAGCWLTARMARIAMGPEPSAERRMFKAWCRTCRTETTYIERGEQCVCLGCSQKS